MSEDYNILVANIIRPHGIEGEVLVRPLITGFVPFNEEKKALLRGEDEAELVTLLRARPHSRDLLVRIRGVQDRTAAQRLQNCSLYMNRVDLPPLPNNTFYLDDLLGMRVVNCRGSSLGEVAGVLKTGGVDVLRIECDESEWLLPTAAEFIVEISTARREMRVSLPRGLRDLNC